MRKVSIAVALAAIVAAVVAVPVFAQATKLTGTVGPGFTIAMAKKPTKAGKYTLVVSDKSPIHNFRLKGPGVNVATTVSGTGSKTFKITLKKGKYTFLCDPHPTSMKGSFAVK
jgi:plastocyanin